MSYTKYNVEVPAVLTDLIGTQNVREEIEKAVVNIFESFAKPELLGRVKVTKPRVRDE